MSALTDLFTALANKIRSKTGTATTYTPLEMVSDGIDDVYAAGYDAGGGGATGIPITPSNASPVSLTTGDSYEMLADGYAISSYNNVTPSNSSPVSLSNSTIYKTGGAGVAIASYSSVTPSNASPVSLSSGSIYKMAAAGKAVSSITQLTPQDEAPTTLQNGGIYQAFDSGVAVKTLANITPNNTSPPSMTNGSIYKMDGANGYAIKSYSSSSKTPTSTGTSFGAGWNYMTDIGYAYSSRPTGWTSATTLWVNTSTTSDFDTQTVTISSMANYSYLRFSYRISKTNSTATAFIVPVSNFQNATGSTACKFGFVVADGSNGWTRVVQYTSNTQILFGLAYKITSSTGATSKAVAIPTYIEGLK